jgi:hypothetical protein
MAAAALAGGGEVVMWKQMHRFSLGDKAYW